MFPPLPTSLLRIRAAVNQTQPDLGVVIDVVSRDLSLAAEVLKTVNSPAFRRSRPLSSIPNAVMMLGAARSPRRSACITTTQRPASRAAARTRR